MHWAWTSGESLNKLNLDLGGFIKLMGIETVISFNSHFYFSYKSIQPVFCSRNFFEPGSKFLWHRTLRRTLVQREVKQRLTANTPNCKIQVHTISIPIFFIKIEAFMLLQMPSFNLKSKKSSSFLSTCTSK